MKLHHRRVLALSVALGAVILGSRTASAQGVLGIVMDSHNHNPLSGVEIVLLTEEGDVAARAITNEIGRYFLAVGQEGTFEVVATSLGYHTNSGSSIELAGTGMTWVEVELVPDAIELPGLTVTQQRYVRTLDVRGYYSRKRRSIGRFIEPSDFEKNMRVPVRELLRRTPLFRSRGALGGRCPTAVIVNGVRRFPSVIDSPELRARYIAAIEVYSTLASAPAEFRALEPRACSMIVIWTDYSSASTPPE